ncbi:alanine--tRNA ligase-related protein, partial [Patescibacteria group bacterium]|nr:alanine--tRNA ligase-related protein [Patescibacteria group bacterium]
MTTKTIVDKYIKFFEERGHKEILNSSLVPENDSTTLFTSSGMQPLVPYLLGEPHPQGTKLVNIQNSFRSQDIEEIGDNRHTTFFRMMGNWSLGSYFKKEQLSWFFEFLTDELKIDPNKLYVSCFEGFDNIPKDIESEEIWKELFKSKNVDLEKRISFYGVDKNWWSRSGAPDKMPAGEPGGPDSEVFYDFGDPKIHQQSSFKDTKCHINCDCGRYLEIGNSVFMQYVKKENGFEELPQKNVDFGGGLERLLAAATNEQDIFKTEFYFPVIKVIEKAINKPYEGEDKASMRVIADHLKASVFIILAGVKPANKEQGYVLRRLLRRSVVKMYQLANVLAPIDAFNLIVEEILKIEEKVDTRLEKERDFK